MNIALILSAGSGERFGGETPKQYSLLMGEEVVAYSVRAFRASAATDGIVMVADKSSVKRLSDVYGVPCITGGAARNGSIKNGLDYIKRTYPTCENVLIQEAARPFITAELIDRYFRELDNYDAVITAQHITDSLGRDGEAVTDRSEYYLIQAPEAFRFALLYRCFSADSLITATVQQLPADRRVLKNFDFRYNMKITYPEDLTRAEQQIKLCVGGPADA